MKLLKIILSLQILLLISFNAAGQGWHVVDTSTSPATDVITTVDGGEAIITGSKIIKYDDRGNKQWEYIFPELLLFTKLLQTKDNEYLGIGFYVQSLSQRHLTIFKLDALGNLSWSKNHFFDNASPNDIIELPGNRFSTVGNFTQGSSRFNNIIIDSVGNLLSSINYLNTSGWLYEIIESDSSNFFTNGLYIPSGSNTQRGVLLKLDQNMDTIWTKTFSRQYSNSMTHTDSFYVLSSNNFITLLDKTGDSLSSISLPGRNIDLVTGTENNNILICENIPVRLTKINQQGNILWEKDYSYFTPDTSINLYAYDILTRNNLIYWCGYLNNSSQNPALFAADSNGNVYHNQINATVFLDLNNNCVKDSNDVLLPNIHATFTDSLNSRNLSSNSDGFYSIPVNEGYSQLNIELDSSDNYYINCLSNPIDFLLGTDTTVNIDIPLTPKDICAGPSVFINSNSLLRSCVSSTYHIYYCNNGTAPLDSAYIELSLSPAQNFLNSSIPWQQSPQDTNLYRFDIGNLNIAECGSFSVDVFNKCGLPIGTALCATAEIYPDTFCVDSTTLWDMSNIEIEADCQSPDSVQFRIINDGSGNMNNQRGIIIVEDNVMYQNFNYQLGSGAQLTKNVPANGATWRLEAEQDTFHPFMQKVAKVVEGCGNGNTSTGFVNIMPLNYRNPFVNTYCDEIIGAYDPNDKKGFPYGVGNQNYISNSDPLNYKIRFQNTGNDTAFYVSIRDTLSEHLKVSSVVSGASSHDYEFEVFGQGVLEWRFKNILLPDSNVNEPKSHGFVEFRVDLKPNLPNGTIIENNAAIYFDFNAPIITNTTFHTVGELGKDYLVWLSAEEEIYESLQINVYPNPTNNQVFIDLKGATNGEEFQIEIFDLSGKQVLNRNYTGDVISVPAHSLDKGMYLIRVSNSEKVIANGKLIKL
ncbi:MAG: T9SS type A sorting domain-containing protein [Chitinophagales bacterium]